MCAIMINKKVYPASRISAELLTTWMTLDQLNQIEWNKDEASFFCHKHQVYDRSLLIDWNNFAHTRAVLVAESTSIEDILSRANYSSM